MINFLKWILSQSQIFNFILLESEIIKNFSYTLKISSIIDVYSKFCRQIKSKIISNQKLPTRTSVNTTRQPFYFEDCRDRCSSEYHGFPFPFHNYKEIISSLDGSAESQKQARYDIDARKPIFYVDAVYDFEQSTWFTGYGLIKDFKFMIQNFGFNISISSIAHNDIINKPKHRWFVTIPDSMWYSIIHLEDDFPRLHDRLIFPPSPQPNSQPLPSSYKGHRHYYTLIEQYY